MTKMRNDHLWSRIQAARIDLWGNFLDPSFVLQQCPKLYDDWPHTAANILRIAGDLRRSKRLSLTSSHVLVLLGVTLQHVSEVRTRRHRVKSATMISKHAIALHKLLTDSLFLQGEWPEIFGQEFERAILPLEGVVDYAALLLDRVGNVRKVGRPNEEGKRILLLGSLAMIFGSAGGRVTISRDDSGRMSGEFADFARSYWRGLPTDITSKTAPETFARLARQLPGDVLHHQRHDAVFL